MKKQCFLWNSYLKHNMLLSVLHTTEIAEKQNCFLIELALHMSNTN